MVFSLVLSQAATWFLKNAVNQRVTLILASTATFAEISIQLMIDLKETGWRNSSVLTKRILTELTKNLLANNSTSTEQVVLAVTCSLIGNCVSQEVKPYVSLVKLSCICLRNLIWQRELT